MAAASLLSLKWNPLVQHFPTQKRPFFFNHTRFLRVSCSQTIKRLDACKLKTTNQTLETPVLKDRNKLEGILDALLKTLKSAQKPATAAFLLGVLLTFNPHSGLAASGGRMGGQSFSSRSSSSSSSSYSSSSSGYSSSSSSYCSSEVGDILPDDVAEVLMVLFVLIMFSAAVLAVTQKTSVVKLQVGLLGSASSLQRDLDRIAGSADTSTKEGLNYVLKETVLALLRHPEYCIYAYSSADEKCGMDMEDVEKLFNQLSIEERGKFDEETLVNVNNIKKLSTSSLRTKGFSNEYIVVTVLVAFNGVLELPVINGPSDLKEALQKLGSVPSSETLAVEVLWTPQIENDTLSEQELLEDYPLLRPLLG